MRAKQSSQEFQVTNAASAGSISARPQTGDAGQASASESDAASFQASVAKILAKTYWDHSKMPCPDLGGRSVSTGLGANAVQGKNLQFQTASSSSSRLDIDFLQTLARERNELPLANPWIGFRISTLGTTQIPLTRALFPPTRGRIQAIKWVRPFSR